MNGGGLEGKSDEEKEELLLRSEVFYFNRYVMRGFLCPMHCMNKHTEYMGHLLAWTRPELCGRTGGLWIPRRLKNRLL